MVLLYCHMFYMYIPYSWKFSIGKNFWSIRPRAEVSKLNSAKYTHTHTCKSVEINSIMHAHAYAAVHDGNAAAKCNLSHFTIFPEWRCRYYHFSRSCRFDSFQALLVRCLPYWLHQQLRKLCNATVTSVREEATAKKHGHYHHLSTSMCAALGKYASKN